VQHAGNKYIYIVHKTRKVHGDLTSPDEFILKYIRQFLNQRIYFILASLYLSPTNLYGAQVNFD
jgi:hypothetical protein